MGEPVGFNGCTHMFGPPPGLDEMVGHLPCFMNGQACVTAWRLTPEELRQVNESGGIVYVSVMSGKNVFPMYVGDEKNVKAVTSDTGKVWE